jgi:TrpR family trp operon transcriptional repressor
MGVCSRRLPARNSARNWEPRFFYFFQNVFFGQFCDLTKEDLRAILFLMAETKDSAVAESFNEICKILAECSTQKDAQEFLSCLCTPAERADFSKRWLSVKELYKGTPQREIAKKFNMSLCKITRGSKELRKENSAFKKILDKLS